MLIQYHGHESGWVDIFNWDAQGLGYFPVLIRRKRNKPCRWAYDSAIQSPDLPPCFSITRTSVITIPRSTALHMS
ncbi:hypothetical protein BCF11_1398 [Collimonas sp. PA-H2]|nr:hypothetical protein BCF11_1398 [Collimonas sp. PA-H2]